MPKDDWAKYARRDRGRRALRSGQFFRVCDADTTDRVAKLPKKKRKTKRRKCKRVIRTKGFVIVYRGATPEKARVREIKSGPLHEGLPPWPGFH